MAKGKKKESLTPEERLQAALVPESEQPYKVPGNWCWVYAPAVFNIEYGKGLPTKELCESGYPVFGANGQIGFYSEYMFEEEKALMSCRGAYSGTMNLSLPKSFITNNSLVIESKLADVSVKFVFYLYSALNKASLISGSAQPQVTVQAFNNYPVPISPLPEQQRIVDRIESLFAKLDEARQKAQDALDSFETRKAAILHKAFTGELTAQWRKEHGVGMESWDFPRFEDCILKMQNGLAKRSGSSGTSFVVLRLANLSDNGFVTDDLREILLDEKEQKNYSLKDNDVLMIRVNGSKDNVGKQFLFHGKLKWAFCDHIIRITYKTNLSPEYMVYFSKTNTYRRYIEDNMVSSAGQNTISRKGMASLLTPIPLMDEQTEIVRILDDLLAKEQQAKEAAERVLEQIELIKKAILARAFRGELGTNDPSEESAAELVKRAFSN